MVIQALNSLENLHIQCAFLNSVLLLISNYVDYTTILQLRNSRGHVLQCSHYVPSTFPNETSLPCVIYCHGNRYHMVLLSTLFLESWFFSVAVLPTGILHVPVQKLSLYFTPIWK